MPSIKICMSCTNPIPDLGPQQIPICRRCLLEAEDDGA